MSSGFVDFKDRAKLIGKKDEEIEILKARPDILYDQML